MTPANICADMVSSYLTQLSADFEIFPSDGGCYVATPFTRPDGEVIELEIAILPGGQTRLADMGDTLGYLYANGLTLTRGVLDKARDIAGSYGVSIERNTLVMDVTAEAAGQAMHRMIQATLAVAHLIQDRRTNGRVVFDDAVESLIIQTGVTYDSDYRLHGSREAHTFKFHVSSGANLLIQPLSAASASAAHATAKRWAYRLSDAVQQHEYLRPVVVLDDRNTRRGVWTANAQAPIADFAILWQDRNQLEAMLIKTLA